VLKVELEMGKELASSGSSGVAVCFVREVAQIRSLAVQLQYCRYTQIPIDLVELCPWHDRDMQPQQDSRK
jgi:hypothetical protein